MIDNIDHVGLPDLSHSQINEILSAGEPSRLDAALSRILDASQEGDCHGFNAHIAGQSAG
jgi:hypothetical protein